MTTLGPGGRLAIAPSAWRIIRDTVRVANSGPLKSGRSSTRPCRANRSAKNRPFDDPADDAKPCR